MLKIVKIKDQPKEIFKTETKFCNLIKEFFFK